jgi:hypothetical protein
MEALKQLESETAVVQRRRRNRPTLRKPFEHAGQDVIQRPRSVAAPLTPPQDSTRRGQRRGGQGRGQGQGQGQRSDQR